MSTEADIEESQARARANTDEVAMLPRLVRLLAAQMQTSFDLLGIDVRNGFAGIMRQLEVHGTDIADHRRQIDGHTADIGSLRICMDNLERRVRELEEAAAKVTIVA